MSTQTSVRCPHCKNKLLHKSEEGLRVRITGVILVREDGFVKAQCHFCKGAVDVPLELNRGAVKPRLLLQKAPAT